jgi:hypothetical protein
LFAVVFLFAAPLAASALTVSPVLFDQTLDPGTSVKGTVRAMNDSDAVQTYYVSVQKFVPDGEEGHQLFLPEDDQTDLASWIRFESDRIEIPPRDSREVAWVANVPSDAEPGGHYGAIFFSTRPPGDVEGVGVGAKTGVLVLLNVNGDIREEMELVSFEALLPEGEPWTNRIPIQFQIRLKNSGSVHVLPVGSIKISNSFGSTATIDANPRRSRSLPAGVRRVGSWWGDENTYARSGFWSELAAEWKNLEFGKYTAELQMEYGRSGKRITAASTFWIIPWHLGVVVLGAVVLLILLLKGYNRLIVRSALRKQAK